ncbi:MAG: NAD(P)/FAD-dependent oxidoreductase, partial [Bacteroidota bacterium]|nr:NAD(P)/FAD-dependent oxidoreductase [Bacteroidota bacterium]MDX5430273.1 NAD(P)/FAD-dependent oxidoreductase [Bacteroidota bacterium]MDX5469034.1 NAD(P)/FAD-dependent oxidoreductase [Bacteroidota bacterium]
CGGIDLSELDPTTCMTKAIPGLFFAGEVMDIDGITGGFNFQAAWTTGYLAGSNAAKMI